MMSIRRRDFLGRLGAGAVSSAMLATPFAAAQAAPLTAAPAQLRDDTWDLSWVERVQGHTAAVFDGTQVEDGGAVFRACVWRDQYHEVYGTPGDELRPVLVLRHEAIPLAMDDAFWSRFDVGRKSKVKDTTGRWTTRNPVATPAPGASGPFANIAIDRLLASGGTVLACAIAFSYDVVPKYMSKGVSREDAEREARSHLLPGVLLQPSGVFATLRAQQAGCAYVLGS